ncbi:MAG: NAD(P)-dependent oxidoreductase [Candidatus Krumholzibacteriia bacterium]
MSDAPRVLVTGAAGYIGSVVIRQLLQAGHRVRGLDALFFGGDALLGVFGHPRFEFVRGDLRDGPTVARALRDVDAVVHLAAIVGDPACAADPDLARAINWDATRALCDRCVDEPRVKRFVFASTCSNYGRSAPGAFVDEGSPLNPVSLYAELKVRFEQHLLALDPRDDFVATALRFATVYGLSPRPRFDLTVNEFVREVTLGRTLRIFGEQFWRPYCHVEDLAGSCARVLASDPAVVRRRVFNVGDTDENYQKKMIADAILAVVPEAAIEYVKKDEDPRDYRVDFTLIRDTLGFAITKRVPDGIREVHAALVAGIFSDPDSPRYRNIA